ncbi:hypothetical protein SS1G_03905 [Sclerotinia sclerotiorum 1980 UF-70]|uniref:Peroxisomal membrane protein PEX14 n=1 Tax=Sclerotinia sclerotiorum (strain ATCC 18683 / 1980 / Ss-1) TaxID=665079 RepID=A7EF14_SCLS1|nr:hypothetical protein SS1G_03905 [Sclerotinia sclerotiorum 1980 UF-70]EDO01430.1 hypothetical protein SS1G_03905 [Sclerotinia sclerotiorum 1980 UF-70]
MSDSDNETKKPDVPAWQLQGDEKQSDEPGEAVVEPPSRTSILEQARKFLEEDEVKNASADKKIAFLESKGLGGDDIKELLGVSRDDEAPNTSLVKTPEAKPQPQRQPQPRSLPPTTQASYSPAPRDQPPIITYPEFLVQPSPSSPLITKHRLLTTLYLFGSFSFLLYGTNTFLIRPMLNTLTESRRSLSSATLNNLQKLIHKLENSVSEIPPTYHYRKSFQSDYLDSDSSSGTLSSLLEDSTYESSANEELETRMTMLKEYLQGLVFPAPFNYRSGAYSDGRDRNGNDKEGEDEFAKVKREIRGVKGVLLSARSFPGGVRAK